MQLDHDQLRQLITLLGESDIQELKLEETTSASNYAATCRPASPRW